MYKPSQRSVDCDRYMDLSSETRADLIFFVINIDKSGMLERGRV